MAFFLMLIILLDELTLHIRSVGHWTNKLHDHFTNVYNFNHMFMSRETEHRNERANMPNFETTRKRKLSQMGSLINFKLKKQKRQ